MLLNVFLLMGLMILKFLIDGGMVLVWGVSCGDIGGLMFRGKFLVDVEIVVEDCFLWWIWWGMFGEVNLLCVSNGDVLGDIRVFEEKGKLWGLWIWRGDDGGFICDGDFCCCGDMVLGRIRFLWWCCCEFVCWWRLLNLDMGEFVCGGGFDVMDVDCKFLLLFVFVLFLKIIDFCWDWFVFEKLVVVFWWDCGVGYFWGLFDFVEWIVDECCFLGFLLIFVFFNVKVKLEGCLLKFFIKIFFFFWDGVMMVVLFLFLVVLLRGCLEVILVVLCKVLLI